MPTPKPGESQDAYIARCIAQVKREKPGIPNDQAAAICHSKWRERQAKEAGDHIFGRKP